MNAQPRAPLRALPPVTLVLGGARSGKSRYAEGLVDYLFAFAATAHCVRDHHFDAVYEAYLEDEEVRAFVEENNPAALKEMSQRLIEAQDRGLWRPRLNSTHGRLRALAGGKEAAAE